MTGAVIHRVTALDLKVESWDWPFARERRGDIAAHFAERQRDKPGLWNGRILLGRNARFDGGTFSASYFEADFASLLAWRDWGFPRPSTGCCSRGTSAGWARRFTTWRPSSSGGAGAIWGRGRICTAWAAWRGTWPATSARSAR